MAARETLFLPLDVLAEVLCRLPVTSLVRFRCVCKQWLSLILSPNLIAKQHARALAKPSVMPGSWRKELSLYNLEYDKHFSFCLFTGYYFKYTVSNPVNGLVCVHSNFEAVRPGLYYLLNPSTREHAALPRINSNKIDDVGLSFDVSTGEYKMVMLYRELANMKKINCKVLSVGDPHWRNLGELPYILPHHSLSVPLNGCLHWIIQSDDYINAAPEAILVFDAKHEQFHLMTAPKCSSFVHTAYMSLMEWGGKLCFVHHPGLANLSVWVLRDYKNQKWVKEYNINMPSFITYPRTIGIAGQELIFYCVLIRSAGLSRYQVIHSYNLRTRNIRERYCGESDVPCGFTLYAESLVSPKSVVGSPSLPYVDKNV